VFGRWNVANVLGPEGFRNRASVDGWGQQATSSSPVDYGNVQTFQKSYMDAGENIVVRDPGHRHDISQRTLDIIDALRINRDELFGHLGVKSGELDGKFWREFWVWHISVYSLSRRKAPIYWQLATPSASYSVWLYIHAFSKDTLFRIQTEYAGPKLAHERRQLEMLRAETGTNPSRAMRKTIEAQEKFVEELQAFFDEVKRIAALWNPDLDDGVIVNFAPLWRLVPHNKPWQKELRKTWELLCNGEYDWAHLAMQFWPERVVTKCATDRSLAIAHGLEDVLWEEAANGKWRPRPFSAGMVDELVRERTSIAVKAALKGLAEASAPIGPKAKTRRSST
jgi:hypothetical protein